MKKTFLFAALLTVSGMLFTSCSEEALPEPELIDMQATGDDKESIELPPPPPNN